MSTETNCCICIVPMKDYGGWCNYCGLQMIPDQPTPSPNPREITMEDIDRMEKEISYLKAQLQIASEQRDNALHLLAEAQSGLNKYERQSNKSVEEILNLSGQNQMNLVIIGRLRSALAKAVELNKELAEIDEQG